MSYAKLTNKIDKASPAVAFELESIYYCLLYFGFMCDAPGHQKHGGDIPRFFHNWLHPEQYDARMLGSNKYYYLYCDDDEYDESVIDHLEPYMQPIAECLKQMRRALKDDAVRNSHDHFIKIIENCMDNLPDETHDAKYLAILKKKSKGKGIGDSDVFLDEGNVKDDIDDSVNDNVDNRLHLNTVLNTKTGYSLNAPVNKKALANVIRKAQGLEDVDEDISDIDEETLAKLDKLAEFYLDIRSKHVTQDNTPVIHDELADTSIIAEKGDSGSDHSDIDAALSSAFARQAEIPNPSTPSTSRTRPAPAAPAHPRTKK